MVNYHLMGLPQMMTGQKGLQKKEALGLEAAAFMVTEGTIMILIRTVRFHTGRMEHGPGAIGQKLMEQDLLEVQNRILYRRNF